jgi:hypothetical protein
MLKEGGKMIDVQNIYLLAQLVNAEEEALKKLERSIEKSDSNSIAKEKEEILQFQKKIAEILEKWS